MALHSFGVQLDTNTYETLRGRMIGAGLLPASAPAQGFTIQDKQQGVKLQGNYANGQLVITILEKPFFAPASLVESKVRGLIQQYAAAV